MAFDVSWVYKIRDNYSRPLKKIIATTNRSNVAMKKSARTAQKLGQRLTKLSSIAGGVAGAMAVVFPVKKAIEFEDVMIDVQKVLTFKTPDQFEQFREGIFKTAIALGKIPQNIADIAVQGGKLGIPVEKMQEFINK